MHDIAKLWTLLHDGKIIQIVGSIPGDVIVIVKLSKLRELFQEEGECFCVHLLNCKSLYFSMWGEKTVIHDSEQIATLNLDIFECESDKGPWRINTECGTLHIDCSEQIVKLDEGREIEIDELEAISRVGLLQDITNEAVLEDYKLNQQEGADFNLLHQFRLPAAQQSALLSQFKFVQLRKEARFSYKTAIVVSSFEQTIKGWSNDFSTEGLQIELEVPMNVVLGQRIYVELPSLQKIAKNQVLVNLPYAVVGFNQARTILHLNI